MSPQLYHLGRVHDVGLLDLKVTNLGILGGSQSEGLNAGWRGDELLSMAGLWIGAIGSDFQPHVSATESMELRPALGPTWTIYDSFENAKDGHRFSPPGPEDADDDGDGLIDEDFQNGLDDDGDSLVDEDYAAIGQQMFSCMYRDDTPEAVAQVPGHIPLGVLVRQRSFQWSASGFNELVGLDFEIVNTGSQQLADVYLGFYVDSDVGPPGIAGFGQDDLVGWDRIDTTAVDRRESEFCPPFDLAIDTAFMWDLPDNGTTATGGDSPAVFGTVLLGHTTDDAGIRAPQRVALSAVRWFGGPGMPPPSDDQERYQLLASGVKPNSNPLPGVALGSAADPGDYGYVMSVGPFPQLSPGESLSFQLALVAGEGFSKFRQNAVMARHVFGGQFFDGDGNADTGVDGKERCLQVLEPGVTVNWDNPCDTLSVVVFYRSTPPCDVAGTHYVDDDCNQCTGVLGKEARVPWVAPVGPPAPATNLSPSTAGPHTVPPGGDGQVTVQWDNSSELWLAPFAGDIFEGFRIWKVNSGSGSYVVPTRADWTRVAEFRLNPLSGQGEADSTHLSHAIVPGVAPIGITSGGEDIYPVGRYEFVDTDVTNENVYFYAVTAFGVANLPNLETGILEDVEVEGPPRTSLDQAVVLCDTCGVVPVRLLSFSAERVESAARVHWTVADSYDHAGFHLYREQPDGPRMRVSQKLLSGRREYTFLDSAPPSTAAAYWLMEVNRTGAGHWYGPADLPPQGVVPLRFRAGNPVPNPFKDSMILSYVLSDNLPVQIEVYDLAGRRVRVLTRTRVGPGEFSASWDGRTDSGLSAAPGLYVIRLEAGENLVTRKVILMP